MTNRNNQYLHTLVGDKDMTNKNKQYLQSLIGLIMIDTALTMWCVSLGAVELNPLCYDFRIFMYMKVIVSAAICTMVYIYLLDQQYTRAMLIFLIAWYGVVTISNILQYVRWIMEGWVI